MNRILPAIAFAVFAAAASAQQPAPAVTPHGCQKPGEHPGRLASENQRRGWLRNANAYLECLKKYVNDQQASYNAIIEKAKPHLDAANATVDEFNKAVAAFKAEENGGN